MEELVKDGLGMKHPRSVAVPHTYYLLVFQDYILLSNVLTQSLVTVELKETRFLRL